MGRPKTKSAPIVKFFKSPLRNLTFTMNTAFLLLCMVAVSSAGSPYFGGFQPDHRAEMCFKFCDEHRICPDRMPACRKTEAWANCMKDCATEFYKIQDCKDDNIEACAAVLEPKIAARNY